MASKLWGRLVFQKYLTNLDIWTKTAVKDSGLKYYEHISTQINNVMTISKDLKKVIEALENKYTLGVVKGLFYENTSYW